MLSDTIISCGKGRVIPNIETADYFFESFFKYSDDKDPKDNNERKIGIMENIITCCNDGGKSDDEEVDQEGIETDNKVHLG